MMRPFSFFKIGKKAMDVLTVPIVLTSNVYKNKCPYYTSVAITQYYISSFSVSILGPLRAHETLQYEKSSNLFIGD